VGRKSGVADETVRLIRVMRDAGSSWQKIADALTAEGVETGQGGKWHAATVRRIYLRAA
jgi:hypothetical protein